MNAEPKLIDYRLSAHPVTCGDTVPVPAGLVANGGEWHGLGVPAETSGWRRAKEQR